MKYMGSKARLAKDLAPVLNKIIQDNGILAYLEPFVGGANMIEHINAEYRAGFDINSYLIALWNGLRYGDFNIPETMTKEEYLYWHELYLHPEDHSNNYSKFMIGCAGFLATYNAKFFGGYAGVVHTKAGTVRDYYAEARRNVLKQLPKVKDVNFVHRDYESISYLSQRYLIYCDPPYDNTTSYKSGWRSDLFWNWVRKISKDKKGHIVLVSEYQAPPDFECIFEKELTTTLDKNSRKKDIEKLFRIRA